MPLRVGTDCSGIEAPIFALRKLGIEYEHIWSCEKDKWCVQSQKANGIVPRYHYSDITTRDHSKLPDIDLYICGFPCQAFSLSGNRLGDNDPRGMIVNHCMEVIEYKKPDYFVLENVKNFQTYDKGRIFNLVLERLQDIGIYNIYYKVYNTKDYGIPQNRERLYIIGVNKNLSYTHPESKKYPLNIKEFLIEHSVNDRQIPRGMQAKFEKKKCILDTSKYIHIFSSGTRHKTCGIMKDMNICSTLQTVKHYVYNYRRYLYAREALNLQGFPKDFKIVVSETQMYKQAGNAMSVNVLEAIFRNLLLQRSV